MGTLIGIRNVCFSYRKRGVEWNIEWKKVELYGFFGNHPKKIWSYVAFGSYSLKNGDTWLILGSVEKNGVIAFSLCWFKTTSALL